MSVSSLLSFLLNTHRYTHKQLRIALFWKLDCSLFSPFLYIMHKLKHTHTLYVSVQSMLPLFTWFCFSSCGLICLSVLTVLFVPVSHPPTALISGSHDFLLIDSFFCPWYRLSHDVPFVFLIGTNHHPAVTQESRKWNHKRPRETSEELYLNLCLDISCLFAFIFLQILYPILHFPVHSLWWLSKTSVEECQFSILQACVSDWFWLQTFICC